MMRWAGEMGESAQDLAQAVASVCSPLDLAACGIAIDQGFNRVVYARRFLHHGPEGAAQIATAPWPL